MELSKPLVSILMTAYNRQEFIGDAIESVLASSYQNFELIIVDDVSNDNTVKIAKSFATSDSRVNVYINKKNLGDYNNRNEAASYAVGKYLKYLDSDDTIYPWGIDAMVYCMEQFPDAAFGLMSQDYHSNRSFPFCLSPKQDDSDFYFRGNLIGMGPTGAIIRKEAFEEINGFSGAQYIGDTEMWYKLAAKWPLVCMPPHLVWWREHEQQQIKGEIKNNKIKSRRYQLTVDTLLHPDCPLNRADREMALRNVKNLCARNLFIGLIKGRFKRSFELMRLTKLSVGDILRSLQRNKYPAKYD